MKCPICGCELESDAKFCVKCGKKVPRCPTCGTILYERSRFCEKDGTPLPEALFADFPPAGGVATAQVSPPPPRPQPAPRPQPVPEQPAPRREPSGKKKKRGPVIAVTVLVVILLLALAAATVAGTRYIMQNGLPFSKDRVSSSSEEDRDSRGSRSDRDSDEDSSGDKSQQEDEIQDALDSAEEHAGSGEYDRALAIIQDALEEYPDSKELKDALEDCGDQYASVLMDQADLLLGMGRLEDARDVLAHGLTQLPEHTEFQDRIDQVDGMIALASAAPPVSMSGVVSVTASSYLSEPNLNLYHTPERVTDGDLSTAWVEGIDGNGVGESITVGFNQTYLVSGLRINAGYQKSEKLYQMNNRPASLTLTFSDGTQQTVVLQDVNARQDVTLSVPVETQSVKLSIASVYGGTTYADTVISELSFY